LSRLHMPLFLWGLLLLLVGLGCYGVAILLAIVRLPFVFWHRELLMAPIQGLLWYSGVPSTFGAILVLVDLFVFFPFKRLSPRRPECAEVPSPQYTVVLPAYNDEESIYDAVKDFKSHPSVKRVIVVNNNSKDRTEERAKEAGAVVVNEARQGYGPCVYRCLEEALRYSDETYVALSEGDRTFRAFDLDKFSVYLGHAEIVNGTRIVEQLRAYSTQLSTFMYYGNFFAGKLLEVKHLGQGTFTDVGTTYKVIKRESLQRLMPMLDPCVNHEFNCHFLDVALANGFSVVECPITFHARVGVSKGGNANNMRALSVGCRMILGLCFGWKYLASVDR
jgi:glycosyltransferase involved in cell wall biosynthesis